MSFSKAKRFVYKKPEKIPSPADYVISTTFEKGCIIPKTPRFREPVEEDDNISICSRAHSHSRSGSIRCSTPNSEKNDSMKDDMDSLRKKIIQFNRNDIKRQYAKRKSMKNKEKPKDSEFNSSLYANNIEDECNETNFTDSEKLCLYGNDEFIDDDYDSFTSSEDLDNLKKIEEYELNEICNAFQKIQQGKSHKNQNGSNFEETVLTKLENIENNMKQFKGGFTKLSLDNLPNNEMEVAKKDDDRNNVQKQIRLPVSDKHDEINSTIKRAIQYLGKQFESKAKTMVKDSEEKIINLIVDIYASSEKSTEQINKLCDNTAEELSKQLNMILNSPKSPALEFTSVGESAGMIEDVKVKYITNKGICNSENDISKDFSQQTQEDEELLDEDNLDSTLKFAGSDALLERQGTLLEVLKDELADLKRSLFVKQ